MSGHGYSSLSSSHFRTTICFSQRFHSHQNKLWSSVVPFSFWSVRCCILMCFPLCCRSQDAGSGFLSAGKTPPLKPASDYKLIRRSWPTGQLADYRRSRRNSCLVWAVLFNWISLYTTLPTASDAVLSDSKNESDKTPVDCLSAPATLSW